MSVVIPVFNGERFIATAVESALAQTYRDREVIAVDDGSHDGTGDVLRRYAGHIRILNQQNAGVAAARNLGRAAASGEIVAFLDGDDWWEPSFLARGVEALSQAADDVCAVVAGWSLTDAAGREQVGSNRSLAPGVGLEDLLRYNAMPPSAVLFRRAPLERVGGFDATLRYALEDWDLSLRLGLAGYRFDALREVLCRYRLHDASMSSDLPRRERGSAQVLEKLFALPDLPASIAARRGELLSLDALTVSALYLRAGDVATARSRFVRAVELWPAILTLDQSLWSIACAEQVHGLLAASPDAESAAQRLLGFLGDAFAQGVPPLLEQRRAALARARRVLVEIAHLGADPAAVRRFAAAAWSADRTAWSDPEIAKRVALSLLGRRVAGWMRRARATTRRAD